MRVPLLDSIAFVLLLPLQLQLATQDRSSSLEAGGDVLKGASQEEELCHGGGDAGSPKRVRVPIKMEPGFRKRFPRSLRPECPLLPSKLERATGRVETGKCPSGGDRGGVVLP